MYRVCVNIRWNWFGIRCLKIIQTNVTLTVHCIHFCCYTHTEREREHIFQKKATVFSLYSSMLACVFFRCSYFAFQIKNATCCLRVHNMVLNKKRETNHEQKDSKKLFKTFNNVWSFFRHQMHFANYCNGYEPPQQNTCIWSRFTVWIKFQHQMEWYRFAQFSMAAATVHEVNPAKTKKIKRQLLL